MSATLLVCALALPPLLSAVSVFARARPAVARVLPVAPLPALLVALGDAEPHVAIEELLLGLQLGLDPTRRTFLAFTAFLWIAAGFYAQRYLAADRKRDRFFAFYLATLAGNLGLIAAEDVAGFYLFFSLMTLASYGMVIHEETPLAHRAGTIYIVLAIVGEIALLLGLMLAAVTADSLLIADIRAATAAAEQPDPILVALLVGFGIKAGLVPLHVWLPLAHPAAPTPGSAVLSGAIIKAGILGLLVFLPLGDVALAGWSMAFIVIGLVTAFFGIASGLPQHDPKTVLAYSSLSQMGLIVCGIGVVLAEPAAAALGFAAITLYALHHALAKGALFLGVGVLGAAGARAWRRAVIAGQALAAAAIAGAPLTSGALAKLELKDVLAAHAHGDTIALLVTLSAAGTTLLMVRFLLTSWRSNRPREGAAGAGAGAPAAQLVVPWLAVLVAGPAWAWWLLGAQREDAGRFATHVPYLWSVAWPILLGIGIAAIALRRHWRSPVPLPEGDLAALVAPLARAGRQLDLPGRLRQLHEPLGRTLRSARERLAPPWVDRRERALASWWAIGSAFLVLTGVLAAALLLG